MGSNCNPRESSVRDFVERATFHAEPAPPPRALYKRSSFITDRTERVPLHEYRSVAPLATRSFPSTSGSPPRRNLGPVVPTTPLCLIQPHRHVATWSYQ